MKTTLTIFLVSILLLGCDDSPNKQKDSCSYYTVSKTTSATHEAYLISPERRKLAQSCVKEFIIALSTAKDSGTEKDANLLKANWARNYRELEKGWMRCFLYSEAIVVLEGWGGSYGSRSCKDAGVEVSWAESFTNVLLAGYENTKDLFK